MLRQISRIEWIIVIAILLLAAVLRLGYGGVNPFASDEARVSVLALEMAQEGRLVNAGISNSTGSRNLPASIYAFVPPYTLSSDPLFATYYVGFLNWLAVLGVWWLVRRVFGAWEAALAALFIAAAPFAVFFSRNIWTQNLLIPMAVAWLLAAYIAATTPSMRWRRVSVALAAFLAGFAFQVHFAGIAIGLTTVYAILRWRWWRNPLAILAGSVLAGLALLPFLYQAACCSPELIDEYLLAEGSSGVDAQALIYSVQAALNRGWDYLAAGSLAEHGSLLVPQLISGMLLIIGIAGLINVGWSLWRSDEQATDNSANQKILLELALLILIAPILAFTYHRTTVRLHYILMLYPALALLVALGIRLRKQNIWRYALTIATLLLVSIWSYQILNSLSIVNEQVAPDGMHTPLKVRRDIAYSVPDDGVVVMHTQSVDYYQRGEPAIWHVLFWDRPHVITDAWFTLLLPPEPAYLMTEIDGIHAWQEMRDTGIMDERLVRFDPMQGAQNHYMQPYAGDLLPQQMIPLEDPVTFDSGLMLIGWYTRHVDGQIRMSFVYEAVAAPPTDTSLRQFTHVRRADELDADPVYFGDGLLPPVWHVGDHVITLAEVTPAESSGTYYVDMGHYSLLTGQRFAHDGGSDYLRFGSFEWSRE